MLHMDDPDDVVDASLHFARAITTGTGVVSAITEDLGLAHRPESELDHRGAQVHKQITRWIPAALTARDDHAGGTHSAVRDAAVTIGNADIDTGIGVGSA